MKAYLSNPNLTRDEIDKLIDLDKQLTLVNNAINLKRREDKDSPTLKRILKELTYQKRIILDKEKSVNVSGMPQDTWELFGSMVKSRSAKIIELVEGFVRAEK